jgi:hypothetical protein
MYRGLLINALNRAIVTGVDWPQALRQLVVRFRHPDEGNPRLANYVAEALQDPSLLANPPLHADILIRQLDHTFANQSHQYQRSSSVVLLQ